MSSLCPISFGYSSKSPVMNNSNPVILDPQLRAVVPKYFWPHATIDEKILVCTHACTHTHTHTPTHTIISWYLHVSRHDTFFMWASLFMFILHTSICKSVFIMVPLILPSFWPISYETVTVFTSQCDWQRTQMRLDKGSLGCFHMCSGLHHIILYLWVSWRSFL